MSRRNSSSRRRSYGRRLHELHERRSRSSESHELGWLDGLERAGDSARYGGDEPTGGWLTPPDGRAGARP